MILSYRRYSPQQMKLSQTLIPDGDIPIELNLKLRHFYPPTFKSRSSLVGLWQGRQTLQFADCNHTNDSHLAKMIWERLVT